MQQLANWTDDRVEQLKNLWTEGLSASQIARALGGVTRNAVIGKVHRLGLAGRASPSRSERPRLPMAPKVSIAHAYSARACGGRGSRDAGRRQPRDGADDQRPACAAGRSAIRAPTNSTSADGRPNRVRLTARRMPARPISHSSSAAIKVEWPAEPLRLSNVNPARGYRSSPFCFYAVANGDRLDDQHLRFLGEDASGQGRLALGLQGPDAADRQHRQQVRVHAAISGAGKAL